MREKAKLEALWGARREETWINWSDISSNKEQSALSIFQNIDKRTKAIFDLALSFHLVSKIVSWIMLLSVQVALVLVTYETRKQAALGGRIEYFSSTSGKL